MAIVPLAQGAWIDHDPAWLSPTEADALFAAVGDELAWEQREIVLFGRRVLQPRLIAWAGELGYRYSGQTLPPRSFTPALARVLAAVVGRTQVPFNHLLANRYRDGRDSMGLHSDDERELGEEPVVATVSLGAVRQFILKPRKAREGRPQRIELAHGSLLVTGGTCQRHYLHGIPRQATVAGERVSLTFRRLLRTPQGG